MIMMMHILRCCNGIQQVRLAQFTVAPRPAAAVPRPAATRDDDDDDDFSLFFKVQPLG